MPQLVTVSDVVRLEMGRFLLDLRKENVNRVARSAADQVRALYQAAFSPRR